MRRWKNGARTISASVILITFSTHSLERPWNISCRCTSTSPASPPSQTEKNALLSLLSNFAAYLVIGARALYGVLPIGDVLLYAGSVTRAMSDLQTFLATGSEFDYINSYLSTYEDFIAQPSMAYDGTLPIEKRDDGQYEFAFHDVSFSYPGTDLPVLEHVTLSFAVGDKTALVGRNGAGKTTLIKLLCRLYEPTSGYITLNGIDIRKYSYKEYTQAFSVVFQDFHLFSLPLDENIAAGTEIDEAALQSSLAKVGLTDRVQQLPQGVRTRLYNNNGSGVDLSGGEAQRTAIARALYKDAPFVILDEPTAALDPIAEAEIYKQFSQMTAGKIGCLHLPPHEQLQILRPHHRPRPRPHRRRRNPRHPPRKPRHLRQSLRNPGPILHLSPHPPVPQQRKWESEKPQPLAVRAKNFQGLCFSWLPLHLFQECKRLLIMNKMHQMIRTHNCYIFFL